MNSDISSSADPIEGLARRRAGAKMGWYIHVGVYLLVNFCLVLLSAFRGHGWAVYPLLGWGLGLLIHGAVVWFVAPGGNLYARVLARERRALRSADPW